MYKDNIIRCLEKNELFYKVEDTVCRIFEELPKDNKNYLKVITPDFFNEEEGIDFEIPFFQECVDDFLEDLNYIVVNNIPTILDENLDVFLNDELDKRWKDNNLNNSNYLQNTKLFKKLK